MSKQDGRWQDVSTMESVRYICGHCGSDITSQIAFYALENGHYKRGYIYICHNCNKPTYFDTLGRQTPGALLGNKVEHLPDDIAAIYDEIRNATAVNSYTAAVLAGRKLLMHIAVEQGAEENKKFAFYVDYLVDKGYAPPNSKSWIDEIRKLGNGANHEITLMGKSEAKTIVKFLEMLMKYLYEFPAEAASEST